MKICYISESTIPSAGADSVHVMKMCNAIYKLGHEISIIGLKGGIVDNHNIYDYYGVSSNIKLILIEQNIIRYLNHIIKGLKIRNIIIKEKPDLLIGRSLFGFYFSTKIGVPFIFESHEPIFDKTIRLNGKIIKDIIYKKILSSKYFQSLVLISEELKKLCNFSDYPNLRIVVAHDGADEQNSFDKDEQWKIKYPLTNIGYFGSFYKGKGIDNLIKIANSYPNAYFHAFGGNQDQIYYFKSIAPKNVIFHGHIANSYLEYYRNNMDILLAPFGKRVEAQAGIDMSSFFSPIKIFEYMSAKKPILCSDLPVIREVLNDSNSILLNPDDIEKWIDALNRIIHDEMFAEHIANNSYNDFINKFTWFKRAESILKKSNFNE